MEEYLRIFWEKISGGTLRRISCEFSRKLAKEMPERIPGEAPEKNTGGIYRAMPEVELQQQFPKVFTQKQI